MGVTWRDKITNVDILNRAGVPSMADILIEKGLRWLGHFYRMGTERLPRQLGPVVQKPINANPRLKINRGVNFSTPKCCSTLIFGKTLH